MSYYKEDTDSEIIKNLCELVFQRKFQEAEKVLIGFIDKTVNHKNGISSLKKKKETLQLIYHSFNSFYHNWVKVNKKNINYEIAVLQSPNHSNYLISHTSNISEMDDLLYELSFFTVNQKEEIMNDLICYKKNSG